MAHIGYVHDMLDLVSCMCKYALEGVLEYIRPKVPYVGIVIDRWSAAIHTNETWLYWHELFDLTGHCVIKKNLHIDSLRPLQEV